MVQFNDSRFAFHDSSWIFYGPYPTEKNIFHESYRVNRTQDYGLKTSKKVPKYSACQFQKHS